METTGFEPMYECFGYTQKHENVSCGMAILLFAHKNPATISIFYIDTTINICYYILVRNKTTDSVKGENDVTARCTGDTNIKAGKDKQRRER